MSLRLGGKGWLNQSINQSINDEGVCRTAPATPGLLIGYGSSVGSGGLCLTLKLHWGRSAPWDKDIGGWKYVTGLLVLEGTARYAALLLSPAEGFGRGKKAFSCCLCIV